MSIQFADSKPSTSDLANFAARAGSIDIGGDIEDLGDNLGIDLITNSAKAGPSSPGRQVSFGGGSTNSNSGGAGSMPSISIKPVDDLGAIDIDAAPGVSDIRINRDEGGSQPFTLGGGASSVGDIGGMGMFDMAGSSGPSAEEERREKQKYLAKLQRLESSGIKGRRLGMTDSLEEIKAEHDKLVDSRNLEASIRFQRNALMTFVSGVEMVNDRVGHKLPVKPRLKGWSESVHTNIEDFDEIFEELYDLYKDRAKMHPLLRLGGTLGMSAVMYHLTNTMAERSGIPGMADLLNENPELRVHLAQAAAQKMGGGLGNFMSGGFAAAGPQATGSPTGFTEQPEGPPPAAQNRGNPMFGASSDASPPPQRARREMRGPANVDDVLRAFEAERMMQQASAASVPISESHAGVFTPNGSAPRTTDNLRQGLGTASDPMADIAVSDSQSVGTTGTMNTERRARRRRTAMPVGEVINLNI